MEASKESTQGESNYSGKLKPYKKDMKYRGVRKCSSGRYAIQFTDPITKQRRGLGTYDTAELAASAYDLAARAVRGTKATTNFLNFIFDPCKFTPSSAPTLGADFNHPFSSKPSNLDDLSSNSLFNKPNDKQAQDHLFFGGSSSKLSSPWDKFGLTNQNISASGHPITTNDFTIPYTQSFQVSSSPTTCTLNMPLQPFLDKTTSAVPGTISTTSSLPNPVFPLHHSSLPITTNDFSIPCPFPYTQSFQVSSSPTTCTLNMPMQPFLNRTTSAVQETISTTSSLPNHHSFLPLVEEQCNTVMPSNPFSSNAADRSYSQETSTIMPSNPLSSNAADCSYSQETIIHSTTDLLNPDLQKGLYVNQNEQQWTEELPASCEWSIDSELDDILPTADFLFEDIDVTTLPPLDNILD